MRRRLDLLAVALLAGPFLVATGCERFQASAGNQTGPGPLLPDRVARHKTDGSSTPGQDAIVRVLDSDREQFHAHFDGLDASAQPSAVAKCIAAYTLYLEKSDTTGCPFEFREARARYARAWTGLKTVLERHPDAYDDVEFMSCLRLLFQGDKIRGRKLGGDVVDAVGVVLEAYGQVFERAGQYNVEVE